MKFLSQGSKNLVGIYHNFLIQRAQAHCIFPLIESSMHFWKPEKVMSVNNEQSKLVFTWSSDTRDFCHNMSTFRTAI